MPHDTAPAAGSAATIITLLEQVQAERERRAADPALHAWVHALKAYQQRRFELTYADLLATVRYAAAARFFLEQLYSARDYSARDAQFARVVPALTRLFPAEIVQTVERLAQVHALTEQLDSAMGEQLRCTPALAGQPPGAALNAAAYVAAWRSVGQQERRERQVNLALEVGSDLDRLVKRPMLLTSLRLMRAPARAAGLEQLQQFLETGFVTFKAMRGAEEFLTCIGQRERALCAGLFDAAVAAASITLPAAQASPGAAP